MPTTTFGREIRLASRPTGWPTQDNFRLVEVDVPEAKDGQVLVRNTYVSVDPYMRGRMDDAESYIPPFALGEVLSGAAVGVVAESRSPALEPGDTVLHEHGWREFAVDQAEAFQKVDPRGIPPSAFLGVLGVPGLTAFVGLYDIAAMREGETVFVSAAAGAVGSLAGQLARLRGASRVIGSAGSADKVAYLREELGFDAAFNYKDGPADEQLAAAAPDGIDVYFDNVGGDQLEAAIGVMNTAGRIALCGAISGINETSPSPGPRNLFQLVVKRIAMRGFIILDHWDRMPSFLDEVGSHVREDRISFRETVIDGIENTPEAFLGVLRGDNVGKMVVRLDGVGA